MRKLAALAALVALAVVVGCWPHTSKAAPYAVKTFVMFDGGTFDSTAHSSKWIPVLHANHIVLRSWSTHAAFDVATDADSSFSDTISTFVTLFSDSVSFMARDSAGIVVTSSSLIPVVTTESSPGTLDKGEPYPICADSVSMTGASYDTTKIWVAVTHVPTNMPLRAPAVGSGILSRIYSVLPGSIQSVWGDGEIGKRYMKVTVTPLRRFTAATPLATAPRRVNGLKGFRMTATVYYQDVTH